MDWMILPLKRYFEFGGRSRRKEFWMFFLFGVILSIAATLIDSLLGFGTTTSHVGPGGASFAARSNGPVGIIVSLGLLIPNLSVAFRRLHDTDRSAWWLLLILVPIVGWLVLLVFCCTEGTRGANRFGPDPKGADLVGVFG